MVVQCCWPACLAYIFSWIVQFDLFPLQDILYLHNSLEEVNSALVGYQRQNDLKLKGMNETVSNLTQRVHLVERDLVALSKAEKQANLSFSMASLPRSFLPCSVFHQAFCLCADDLPPPFQTVFWHI